MRSLEQVNIRTNVRTYVRTYSHTYVRDRPYIPSTTLLCEGIINYSNSLFSINRQGKMQMKLKMLYKNVLFLHKNKNSAKDSVTLSCLSAQNGA